MICGRCGHERQGIQQVDGPPDDVHHRDYECLANLRADVDLFRRALDNHCVVDAERLATILRIEKELRLVREHQQVEQWRAWSHVLEASRGRLLALNYELQMELARRALARGHH